MTLLQAVGNGARQMCEEADNSDPLETLSNTPWTRREVEAGIKSMQMRSARSQRGDEVGCRREGMNRQVPIAGRGKVRQRVGRWRTQGLSGSSMPRMHEESRITPITPGQGHLLARVGEEVTVSGWGEADKWRKRRCSIAIRHEKWHVLDYATNRRSRWIPWCED